MDMPYDAAGALIPLVPAPPPTHRQPASPPAGTLTIDEATNAAVAADLRANPSRYRVVAGALQRDGQPVAVAAPGELAQDRGDLPALLAALAASRDALLDTGQAFSIATIRPIIARTITLELLIVRELRRRGL